MPVRKRAAYIAYQWFWRGLDWLYPPRCAGCGQPGSHWCAACQDDTPVITGPVCARCGEIQATSDLCSRCKISPPGFEALRSWAIFGGPLRKAIHWLKYKRNIGLGIVFADPLMDYLDRLHWSVDLVAPVPLGVARLAERGYNQASLLARPVALGLGWQFCPAALMRTRETRSQVDLTYLERKDNVAGAFTARPDLVNGRSVLVIDDVATSGSTLDACAKALLQAGARQVLALTLARAAFGTP